MPPRGAAAGLFQGIAQGAQIGLAMRGADIRDQENERAQERHNVQLRKANIEFDEYGKDAPNRDKATQLRGMQIDAQLLDQGFADSMRDHQQQTRRIQMDNEQRSARMGGVAGEAAAARQPDELALLNQKLLTDTQQGIQQGAVLMWDTFRLGDKEGAIKMFNGSSLVLPGQKATDAVIEDAEVPSADGKGKTKTKVLTLKDADGKVLRSSPVEALEALSQRYGAKYEKVDKALVRIGRDGKPTVIYEGDKMMVVPEGSGVVNERTGAPPAAGGVRPTGPTSKETTRIDDRVKMASAHIDKLTNAGSLAGLDPNLQPLVNMSKARAGVLTRAGMNPEEAGAKAWLEAKGGRLNPDGTPKTGAAAPAEGAKSGAPQLPKLW